MDRVESIFSDSRVKLVLESFESRQEELIQQIIKIQQIPSPTFAEAERAHYIESRFIEIGLSDVSQNDLHNVYGVLKGRQGARTTPLIITAHCDTVFPIETNLTIRQSGSLLSGPGIGDNSSGVGGLIFLAQSLIEHGLIPQSDLWFVANVGEEGMGNLCGIRAVVERFGSKATYIVVEGGLYGQISHQTIGVKRYRIEVNGPGGHSWGSFGQTSAIHEIAHFIAAIDNFKVPSRPKTTFNVGVIEGGTTVNSIASSAAILLDLRSADAQELTDLINRVNGLVEERQLNANKSGSDIHYKVVEVGDRPAGAIPRNRSLVRWATRALNLAGCPTVSYIVGSTDANIPLSLGIPTVCVGLTVSGNSHRLDEFIDTTYLSLGMKQLLLLSLAASGFE